MSTQPLSRAFSVLSITQRITPQWTATRSFSAIPHLAARNKPGSKGAAKGGNKQVSAKEKSKKKKKKSPTFTQYDLKDIEQFTLCDAMRYIKAFEVGRNPRIPKYDLAIKLKTNRDGPVVRNTIRLPHAVKTDIRVAVICPPDSPAVKAAKAAGASIIGEDEVIEQIKNGQIEFDRCVAHPASVPKMNKAGIPRILGPRGLMPSAKMGTIVEKVGPVIQTMLGGSMYRERAGVVRMAVGQLAFTPEQLRDNVKTVVDQIKQETARFSEQWPKEVWEIVLSSTHSPGFSLNGQFKSDHSPPTSVLSKA